MRTLTLLAMVVLVALVSTAGDMGRLLAGILDGTAPGQAVTRPLVSWPDAPQVADVARVEVGLLRLSGRPDADRVLLHTGETEGYRSAVVVESTLVGRWQCPRTSPPRWETQRSACCGAPPPG